MLAAPSGVLLPANCWRMAPQSSGYVKEQMGHASIQTTVDIYGHLIQGANRNEVNRLEDAAFGGAELLQKAG